MPVSIVLVSPLFSGNLGSVARAMKNMGLKELRLVDPKADPKDLEARKMAAHSQDILDRAKVFPDLKKALEGFDLSVATSRRKGGQRGNWRDPKQLAGECARLPKSHRVALVFGREDTGLSNDEISLCQRIATIPSHRSCASLNLAQAVMVMAYEIFSAKQAKVYAKQEETSSRECGDAREKLREKGAKPAKNESIEAMYQDLGALLGEIGFLNRQNPKHLMYLLRNFFNRARPTDKEVRIFRGLCRQVRWWGSEQGLMGQSQSKRR